MAQLYTQRAVAPDSWDMSGAPATTVICLAVDATINYSDGSADTLPANTPAVLPDTTTSFDRTHDVYVPYTVQGSGVLSIIKESLLPTLAAAYAPLARVELHGIKPYQPQAYLGAGGVGTVPPSSYALVSDTTALRKSLWTGSTNNDPDVTYAGWTTLSFTESGWAAAVVATLGVGQSVYIPSGASPLWDSAVPTVTASPGEAILLRQHFVLPAGTITGATLQCAFDAYGSAYLNGTLIGGESGLSSGPLLTLVVPPGTLLGGAANVIALKVYDDGGGGSNKAWATWRLDVQYVASGGIPAPTAAEGDLLYYHSGAWVPLPAGTNGYELTLVSGDPAWTAQPSGGVTSVALTVPSSVFSLSGSPITGSGTMAVGLQAQTAHTFWGGPASGSAAAPTFRALQGSDLPAAAGAGGHIHAHGQFH